MLWSVVILSVLSAYFLTWKLYKLMLFLLYLYILCFVEVMNRSYKYIQSIWFCSDLFFSAARAKSHLLKPIKGQSCIYLRVWRAVQLHLDTLINIWTSGLVSGHPDQYPETLANILMPRPIIWTPGQISGHLDHHWYTWAKICAPRPICRHEDTWGNICTP